MFLGSKLLVFALNIGGRLKNKSFLRSEGHKNLMKSGRYKKMNLCTMIYLRFTELHSKMNSNSLTLVPLYKLYKPIIHLAFLG